MAILVFRLKIILLETVSWSRKSGGPLAKFLGNLRLLFQLLRDYYNRRHTKIPWAVIAMIVFALLCILNPFDLIPDFVPVFGLADDAACLAVCLSSIDRQTRAYSKWRESKGKSHDDDENGV